jgi:hypothetical protein
MIRTASIAALVAFGSALPALADDGKANAAYTSVHAQELKNVYDAKQAHNILASRGFVNISALGRDDDGRWTGIATKDGKTIFVAVALPQVPGVSATN